MGAGGRKSGCAACARSAIKIGREDTAETGTGLETEHGCGATGAGGSAIQCAHIRTHEAGTVGKQVEGEVITVSPYAYFRIIRKVRAERIGVAVVRAGGIGS